MKRIISIILALTLVLALPITAGAASVSAAELETAVKAVKSFVTIPEELSDFDYQIYEYEKDTREISLTWNHPQGEEAIHANVVDGRVVSYYRFGKNDIGTGLGNVSKDESLAKAKKALVDLDKTLGAKMELVEDGRHDTYSHNFGFIMKENGVPVDFVTATVSVNKYTGEISNLFWYMPKKMPVFPSSNNVISKDAAEKAYVDADGVQLEYHLNYDYQTKTTNVFLGYTIKNSRMVVDALTGEAKLLAPASDETYYALDGMGAGEAKSNETAAEPELSKEEINKIEEMSGLISAGEAQSAVKKMFPKAKVTSGESSQLSRSYDQLNYYWTLSFDGGHAVVNAKTSEVVSYYSYTTDDTSGKPKVSAETALKTAQTFLETNVNDKFKQTAGEDLLSPYEIENLENIPAYYFTYDRMVGEIPFKDNNLSVAINSMTGEITSYSCRWHNEITFPAVPNDISASDAFGAMDKATGFEMYYTFNGKDVELAYKWADLFSYLIDPVTGGRIGYDGKPYKEVAAASYDDLTGHWAESIINKLVENNYYIEGNSFEPKKAITQEEFLRYIFGPEQHYYDQEGFYKMLTNQGIIQDGDANPAAELSRYDAAKFTVRFLGQDRIASHHEVFINPFADQVKENYKGYAATAYALSIMKGDGNRNFAGDRIMTRAEAAVVIYNTLQLR